MRYEQLKKYPTFEHPGYDIDPKNMEKRVRVFINQLLPGIVNGVETVGDLEFAFSVLGRHLYRFTPRLVEAGMPDELLAVLIAVSDTTTKLLKRQAELITNDERKKH